MTADRTTALDAAQRILKRTKSGYSSEEFGCYLPNDDAPITARTLLSTAKDADRMRKALEITRMQLNVSAAGKIALSPEKHLSIVEAALRPSEGTKD